MGGFQALKSMGMTGEVWKRLGLSPDFRNPTSGSVVFSESPAVSLTAREMAAVLRWDRQIFRRARYDVALGVSLASKGVVSIVGWIADERITLGESPPDFLVLTPKGPMDSRDARIHAEIHALCELTPVGRNLLKHNGEVMKNLLEPNRTQDPVLLASTRG